MQPYRKLSQTTPTRKVYQVIKVHLFNRSGNTFIFFSSTFVNFLITFLQFQPKGTTNKPQSNGSTIEFPVIKVAADNGWEGGVVKRELKNLQWTTFTGPGGQGNN